MKYDILANMKYDILANMNADILAIMNADIEIFASFFLRTRFEGRIVLSLMTDMELGI